MDKAEIKEKTLRAFREYAPSLDEAVLALAIDENLHGNSTDYILGRVFNNAFTAIPKEFPDLQLGYFNVALHYFRTYPLEDQTIPAFSALSNLAGVCGTLLQGEGLHDMLGESDVYHKTAEDIIQFYDRNKGNPGLLHNVGNALIGIYMCLEYEVLGIDSFETEGFKVSALKRILDKARKTKNPSSVAIIWEAIKAEAGKGIRDV